MIEFDAHTPSVVPLDWHQHIRRPRRVWILSQVLECLQICHTNKKKNQRQGKEVKKIPLSWWFAPISLSVLLFEENRACSLSFWHSTFHKVLQKIHQQRHSPRRKNQWHMWEKVVVHLLAVIGQDALWPSKSTLEANVVEHFGQVMTSFVLQGLHPSETGEVILNQTHIPASNQIKIGKTMN